MKHGSGASPSASDRPLRRSINGKLSRLVVMAVGAAMVFVAGFGCWQETNLYLAGKRDILLATANAFAAASADAVAAGDRRGGLLAIRGIGSVPAIDFAALTDRGGRSLAAIGSGVRLAGDLDITGDTFSSSPLDLLATRTVSVTVPVRRNGETIGRLRLVGRVADLWARLRNVLVTTAAGALAALAIGLAISIRLQRSITRPLVELTRAMGAIRTSHDYETRVEIESDDEIGLLAARFNGMIGDVLERDQRLVAHRDRLEHDVAERTQDLRLAKDDAEAANIAKSTFLATMSHEIRTPMTGLLVMAELLASSELPARSRRHAEVICKSGSALLAIINDILDFSKIEAGKLEVEKIEVDVREVVNTVVALFFTRSAEKNLDLAARFAPDVPARIEGDPTRLQQVVSNLVNNALKFTSAGHVLVDVTYDDGRLVCAVVDTGIGIAPDKLERIFQAFSQADGTTTREFGGTGLGLSISSRLATAMGGDITVASAPGLGSTFTCSIPARSIAPTTARPASAARGRVRVSLDRPATAQAIAAVLGKEGFGVAGASDGPSEPVDILVTDARGAAEADSPTATNTKMIRVSAPGDPSFADEAFVLRLPVVESDLEDLLERIATGGSASPRSVAAAPDRRQMFASARVLVADDSAVNREVMIEALSRFGILPDLAVNGLDAFQAASTSRYDLVFMDGSMPELDGFDACRRLRACEGDHRSTPVLALTAHVVGDAANAWRAAGMNGVLHKPFTMAELERALSTYIQPRPVGVAADDAAQRPVSEPGQATLGEGAAEPLLDPAVLAEIGSMSRGAQHGFAARVLTLFLEHAPRGAEAVMAAQVAQDGAALAAAAHSIKSMSLNIGARQVGSAAAALEALARAGRFDATKVEDLDAALLRTCEEIRARLATLAPPNDGDVSTKRSAASCVFL